MSKRGWGWLVGSTLLGMACGGTPEQGPPVRAPHATAAAPAPQTPPDPEADRAPTPFTAAQIRDATQEGRTYEFLIEQPDKPAVRRRLVFVAVSDERATLSAESFGPDGKPVGSAELSTATWDELRRHASFPKVSTSIGEERLDTPIGAYDCLRYTVLESTPAGEKRTTYWFAKQLPGAPVEVREELGGEVVSRMALLRYGPGGRAEPPDEAPPPSEAELRRCLDECDRQSHACSMAAASPDPNERGPGLRECGCARLSCEQSCHSGGEPGFACR